MGDLDLVGLKAQIDQDALREARLRLRLTECCLEANADDERFWRRVIAFLEEVRTHGGQAEGDVRPPVAQEDEHATCNMNNCRRRCPDHEPFCSRHRQ